MASEETESKDVNDHLVTVGNFGLYQWYLLSLNGFLVCTFAMQMFVSVFTHADVKFRCVDNISNISSTVANQSDCNASSTAINLTCPQLSSNDEYYNNNCTVTNFGRDVDATGSCKNFEYDISLTGSSIVSEFDLVCHSTYIVTIVDVSWMVSEGFGTILGSYISDRFGRRPMLIVAYLGLGLFGTLAAVSPHITMYTICRCLMGSVAFAGFSSAIAIISESVAPNKRSHALNALSIFWVAGSLALPGIAYIIPHWRYLQLAVSVLALPVGIACIWLLDESPHWLVINNEMDKALLVLQKMARWNKVEIPRSIKVHQELLKQEPTKKHENCCEIWRYRRVLVRFIIISIGWIVCSFCYYTLSFGVSNLPGSIHVVLAIMAVAEGLSYAACFSIAWLGRKWTTVVAFFGGGISLLVSALVGALSEGSGVAVTVLSVFGKFFASGAWQILFVWSSELYPTTQRCLLVSLNSVIGRLGNILAPVMLDLNKLIEVPNEELIIPIMYVVFMFVGGLLHAIPPETKNINIPDTFIAANVVRFEPGQKTKPDVKVEREPNEEDNFLEEKTV